MSTYDALLFDHDGVLVDLPDRSVRIRELRKRADDVCRENGRVLADDEIEQLAFTVIPEEFFTLSERLDADPERLWRTRDDVLADILKDDIRTGRKRPYPDVDTLSHVELPLGIASNNQRRVIEFSLEYFGLREQFGTIRAREPNVGSLYLKKPSPTFLQQAKADLEASNPLYVGDQEHDVVAGQRAGMDVAFVRREHNADDSLDCRPAYDVSGLDEIVSLVS